MMSQFNENRVPDQWSFAYFSTKPLSNWKEDLSARYHFFREWVATGTPNAFWISAFTFPTGFTTSLLQRFSRKKDSPPIDRLDFDFIVQTRKLAEFMEGPKDGAYIWGLYLEGGKWDEEKGTLCEPEVMELYVPMPVIHFKPISKRAKPPQSIYECPCYYYPIRKGTVERDSYMMKVDLKMTSDFSSPLSKQDFWIKRGTALLMSTGT
jgi:dynein heavy chain